MTAAYSPQQDRIAERKNRTIMEMARCMQWSRSRVSLNDMHFSGSKCFVHVPTEKRRKLDQKGSEMTFLGHDNESKAFRYYNPATRKVEISRDVTFPEEVGKSTKIKIDFQPQMKEGNQKHKKESKDERKDTQAAKPEEKGEKEEDVPVDEEQIYQRISARSTKGKSAKRFIGDKFDN